MIKAKGLSKSYGAHRAVDNLDLTVEKGELFGLLGPNGAGKSTTIAMLAGLLAPDQGAVQVAGEDPASRHAKRRIGLAPQSLALYDRLTAEENLQFFGRIAGLGGGTLAQRIGWSLETAGLADRRKEAVSNFSGGMKRRLNLVCALIHEPELVFLDEPTTGVDPQSRNYLFETIENLRDEGLTIIYTTHYMEEAQRLCDRIAIMDKGAILCQGTVQQLIDRYGGESTLIAEFDRIPKHLPWANAEEFDSTLKLRTSDPFGDLAKLASAGSSMKSLRLESPDLESVFLTLTGRSLRD